MFRRVAPLIEYYQTGSSRPHKLFFKLTERCNLACRSCFVSDTPDVRPGIDELTDEEALRVIDEAFGLGVSIVEFMGGEVLIRRRLFKELLKRVKRHNGRGEITTNGSLIDDELARLFVDLGWEVLTVSLDSPDAQTHDYLRGKEGTWLKTVAGVKKVLANRKTSKTHLPLVTLQMVVSNKNLHQLEDMVEFAHSLGVTNLSFIDIVTSYSVGAKELALNDEQQKRYPELVAQAAAKAEKLGVGHNLASLVAEDTAPHVVKIEDAIKIDAQKVKHPFFGALCFVPFNEIVVFSDGAVAPCLTYMYWTKPEKLNELNIKQKSLTEIWSSDIFENVRKAMLDGALPGFCSGCCTYEIYENRILRSMGLYELGDFKQAFQTALDGLKDFSGQAELIYILINIIFESSENSSFLKTLAAAMKSKPPPLQPKIYSLIKETATCKNSEENQAALKLVETLLAINRPEFAHPFMHAMRNSKKFPLLLFTARHVLQNAQGRLELSMTHWFMAEAAKNLQSTPLAIAHALTASQSKELITKALACYTLASCYQKTGDKKQAEHYKNLADKIPGVSKKWKSS